jgi:hypothetical protein
MDRKLCPNSGCTTRVVTLENITFTDTPLWRRGPNGPNTLCNSCGIRWKRNQKKFTDSKKKKSNDSKHHGKEEEDYSDFEERVPISKPVFKKTYSSRSSSWKLNLPLNLISNEENEAAAMLCYFWMTPIQKLSNPIELSQPYALNSISV